MLIRLTFNSSTSKTFLNFGKSGTFKYLYPRTLPFAPSSKVIEYKLDECKLDGRTLDSDRHFLCFVLKLREKDMQLLPIRISIRVPSNIVYLTYKDRSTRRNMMLSTEIELPL